MDHDNIEHLKNTDLDEEESEFRKRVRKTFFKVISILLLVMILTYFLGFEVYPYLKGRAVSSKINEKYEIPLQNGGKVVFTPGVYEELNNLYIQEERHEIKVCLEGEKIGEDYHITSLKIPKIHSQSVMHVSADLCDEKTIIPLHSHPVKSCIFSTQDINSYQYIQERNPDSIIGLICEPDRFTFYGFE